MREQAEMSDERNRAAVERLWRAFDERDFDGAGEQCHEDVVLEWPQSRERIRGRANLVEVNRNYPGDWKITIERIVVCGESAVSQVAVRIDGRTEYATSFFELRDEKIATIREFWAEEYQAPEWRARWVEQMRADA